jgi:hypothetical protein
LAADLLHEANPSIRRVVEKVAGLSLLPVVDENPAALARLEIDRTLLSLGVDTYLTTGEGMVLCQFAGGQRQRAFQPTVFSEVLEPLGAWGSHGVVLALAQADQLAQAHLRCAAAEREVTQLTSDYKRLQQVLTNELARHEELVDSIAEAEHRCAAVDLHQTEIVRLQGEYLSARGKLEAELKRRIDLLEQEDSGIKRAIAASLEQDKALYRSAQNEIQTRGVEDDLEQFQRRQGALQARLKAALDHYRAAKDKRKQALRDATLQAPLTAELEIALQELRASPEELRHELIRLEQRLSRRRIRPRVGGIYALWAI